MPSCLTPVKDAANAIFNAHTIGKEPANVAVFPFVAITIEEHGLMAFGRSSFAAGYAFSLPEEDASLSRFTPTLDNTVLLELDEAHALQSAIRKTSTAKSARVWTSIDGGRLTVAYGDESLADLPTVEFEPGDLETIIETAGFMESFGETPRQRVAISAEVIRRFGALKPETNKYIDMAFLDVGNTTFARVGPLFVGAFEALDREIWRKAMPECAWEEN